MADTVQATVTFLVVKTTTTEHIESESETYPNMGSIPGLTFDPETNTTTSYSIVPVRDGKRIDGGRVVSLAQQERNEEEGAHFRMEAETQASIERHERDMMERDGY